MLTFEQFRRIFPACPASKANHYLPLLIASMRESGITTRRRAASYFAQLGHESLDFKFMEEIASGAAYEGAKRLGNTEPGDGRRFKGRGPIQTTGRFNYTRAGIALNLPLTTKPELLSIPANGFRASAFFWKSEKLNREADSLTLRGDAKDLKRFDKITLRVNGGYNGRVDRQRRYLAALAVLTEAQFEDARLEHTLDVLTTPAPAPEADGSPQGSPQASGAPAGPVQGQPAPAAAPAQATPEASLLEEIPVNDSTKRIGKTFAARAGVRLARPVAVLWAALEAGNVYAILGVAVALVGLGYLAYVHRDGLRRALRWVLRKVKG